MRHCQYRIVPMTSLDGQNDLLEKIQPIKNSVSGSCVEVSCDAILREGVCTSASRDNEEAGRVPICADTS